MDEIRIQLEEVDNKGRAYVSEAGKTLAEMTYSKAGESLIIIDHTEVSPSLRGQGVGRKLLDTLVAMVREKELKVLPLCPYAKSEFDKDPSIQDVLRGRG